MVDLDPLYFFWTRWAPFSFDYILCCKNNLTSIYLGKYYSTTNPMQRYWNWRKYYFFQNILYVTSAICFGTCGWNTVLVVFMKVYYTTTTYPMESHKMKVYYGVLILEWLYQLFYNFLNILSALSRWCISYRKKAKQIVETWDKSFKSAQREQRVSFLYLANDILQNSRRRGSEFVNEFWKVLPASLKQVYETGDDNGKKVASRLVIPFLLLAGVLVCC